MDASPIYVERDVEAPVDALWERTQDPGAHERWDLRFSDIEYLPNVDDEPQRFTYRTRIGFGLAIEGTGESVARNEDGEVTTSVLTFDSDDPKSLIEDGRGFWRYVETDDGTRFLTEYNYETRWGRLGRVVDRIGFRPLLGWATAFGFDVLARWAEDGTPPETSYRTAFTHAIATMALGLIWLYQGLVPKLLVRHPAEIASMEALGLGSAAWTGVLTLGVAEVLLGIAVFVAWRSRWVPIVAGLLSLPLVVGGVILDPASAIGPVNPIVTAIGMVGLGVISSVLAPNVPTARNCRREPSEAT